MKAHIKIEQDIDATSPAEWEDKNLFIVANHRECYMPEPGEKRITLDASGLVDKYRKTHWIFRLEAYIHSGVILALSGEGNFPDRQWDVSQVGFVFAAKSEWRLSKSARSAALCKVNEWNEFFSGDVWAITIEDDNGNHLDSCGGFYGHKYASQEAESMRAACQRQLDAEEKEASEMACRDMVTV